MTAGTGRRRRASPWAAMCILGLFLAGCRSMPKPATPPAIVIEWPEFPDPTGKVTLDGETVTMPADYWLAVAQYVVDMEAARKLVEAGR